ncbi:MAG: hypothetical protein K0B06_05585, partial [Brevefilum sp.]|nr:hypothetical protein [Brevefilum sp.]
MNKSLNLLIAGDFAPVKQFGCPFNENLFHNLTITQDNDYNVVNLEGSLTNLEHPQKKMGPVLSIDPKWAS